MKIKKLEIASFLKTLKSVQPKRQLAFEKIMEGVNSKELYGFLIVDVHTLDDLKYFCRDFPHYKEQKHIQRRYRRLYAEGSEAAPFIKETKKVFN